MSDGTVQTSAAYFNGQWLETDGRGVEACSFHAHQTAIYGIPVQVLLRALDKCGYLDQWNRKQQTLDKVQP